MPPIHHTIPQLSEQDYAQLRLHLILPLILTMLDRELQNLRRIETLRLKQISIWLLMRLMDAITTQLRDSQKHLKLKKIRVIEEVEASHGLACRYRYHGYEHTFALQRAFIRAEIEIILSDYLRRFQMESC